MKKKCLLFIFICITAFSISGCGKNYASVPKGRVVTGVDVTCQRNDTLIRRHYTDTEKMESVLIYIRLAVQGRVPEIDPNSVDADLYEIHVQLSDGQTHNYKQKDHRYFYRQKDGWRTLDPKHAAKLYSLLRHYESDAPI